MRVATARNRVSDDSPSQQCDGSALTASDASPSQINLADGQTYRLNAVVASGSPSDAARQALSPSGVSFQVQDKDDPTKTVKVVYKGLVPETFQDGREIVVTGHMVNGEFVGKRDSLLAKCPSKFSSQNSA